MKTVNYGILSMLLAGASVIAGCGSKEEESVTDEVPAIGRAMELELARLSDMLRPTPLFRQPYDWKLDSMPSGGIKLHVNPVGGTLAKVFNDSNYLQLQASRALGIRPIMRPSEAWHTRRPLVKISSNPDFYVDNLTHSMPYLVPEAATLLHDIGRSFNDSLKARGGGAYRIKVTSVLRTPTTVKSLRRRNANAVEESTHLYGTTFDISHAQFVCDNDSVPRTQEDLKNLLAEVLLDLKRQNRCYVKYERKQACFHITARPDGS